jgi:hypothetical protein
MKFLILLIREIKIILRPAIIKVTLSALPGSLQKVIMYSPPFSSVTGAIGFATGAIGFATGAIGYKKLIYFYLHKP